MATSAIVLPLFRFAPPARQAQAAPRERAPHFRVRLALPQARCATPACYNEKRPNHRGTETPRRQKMNKRLAACSFPFPFLLCVSVTLWLGLYSLAQAAAPLAPPPPQTYDVQISYRINAFRNQRLMQYYEMLRFLKKAGFQRDPDEEVSETEAEDVKQTRMRGTIPGRQARELLNERHIRSILLWPHDVKPPEDKSQAVRVEI